MANARLTSKGRMTIPQRVRDALRLQVGDRVAFVETEPGRFELIAATNSVKVLKGMLGETTKTVSIEEMNVTIATRSASAK
jgi:antitoxin PrlF